MSDWDRLAFAVCGLVFALWIGVMWWLEEVERIRHTRGRHRERNDNHR